MPRGESISGVQVACTDKEFALNELKVQPHGAMLEAKADRDSCLNTPSTSQPSPPCMPPLKTSLGCRWRARTRSSR